MFYEARKYAYIYTLTPVNQRDSSSRNRPIDPYSGLFNEAVELHKINSSKEVAGCYKWHLGKNLKTAVFCVAPP
jgi:hypothetical protein